MASFRDRVLPSSPDVFPSICPGRRTTQQFSASLPELGTKRHSGVSCRVLASRHLESAGRDRWACSHNDRRTTLGGGGPFPCSVLGGPFPCSVLCQGLHTHQLVGAPQGAVGFLMLPVRKQSQRGALGADPASAWGSVRSPLQGQNSPAMSPTSSPRSNRDTRQEECVQRTQDGPRDRAAPVCPARCPRGSDPLMR